MKTTLFLFIIFLAQVTLAQTTETKESDKLDIKKLEEKYWGAKDDDYSVIQNRAFPKAKRYFLNVSYGIPINDPYSKGSLTGLTGGYFFNERMGVEATLMNANFTHNDSTQTFMTDHATLPNHNKFISSQTLSWLIVPFYAKMSFWDKKIIYFDMGVGLGVGQTTYESQINIGNKINSAMHYSLDITQHFFFTEHWDIRFDFRNKWTQEERFRYKINPSESESARSIGSTSINDTSLNLGITYWH